MCFANGLLHRDLCLRLTQWLRFVSVSAHIFVLWPRLTWIFWFSFWWSLLKWSNNFLNLNWCCLLLGQLLLLAVQSLGIDCICCVQWNTFLLLYGLCPPMIWWIFTANQFFMILSCYNFLLVLVFIQWYALSLYTLLQIILNRWSKSIPSWRWSYWPIIRIEIVVFVFIFWLN